jgi:hypothetical protein
LETEIEDYDDQQQGSEEENEATIAEELAYLQQENERLRLEEENMTRQRVTSHPCNTIQEESHAVASRTREREGLAELQQTINIHCQQEQAHEPP